MIINFKLEFGDIMKKTYRVVLIIACVCILLFSCGCSSSKEKTDNGKIKIVASAFPQYDLVRSIAGDKADIVMLLPAGSEIHTYDPSVKDIMNVAECDVFVYNGGESDMWVNRVIDSAENKSMTGFAFMENCTLLEEKIVIGMQHEHDEEHENEETSHDEHVWTSPVVLMEIAEHLTDVLCEKNPENADVYKENYESYKEELLALDEAFRNVRQASVRNTLVFGDRFPFAYFAEEYDLEYYAAFPGCASNTEASAKTLAFLSDKVKEENIPAVFTIEFSDGKIADAVCSDSGAKKLLFHSCHNVTKSQFDEGVTYLSLMYENVDALREAICS